MIVVHLLDPESPDCGRSAMRLVGTIAARSVSDRHVAIVLGGRVHALAARACGAPVEGSISLRAGRSTLASAVRSISAEAVVHAWSFRSALRAAAALPDRAKLATLTAGPPPGEADAGDLGAARRVRRLNLQAVPVIACSEAVARAVERAGVRPRLVAVVEPPVVPHRGAPSRERLRRRWRLPEGAFVVGVLADPAPWSSARTVVQSIARSAVAARDARVVLPAGLQHASAMRTWFRALSAQRRVIIDDEVHAPWMLLPGIDAAFVPETIPVPRRAPGVLEWLRGGVEPRPPVSCALSERWARAMGIPVLVETASAGTRVNDLALRILELADSAAGPRVEWHSDEPQVRSWVERYESLYRRLDRGDLWSAPGRAETDAPCAV